MPLPMSFFADPKEKLPFAKRGPSAGPNPEKERKENETDSDIISNSSYDSSDEEADFNTAIHADNKNYGPPNMAVAADDAKRVADNAENKPGGYTAPPPYVLGVSGRPSVLPGQSDNACGKGQQSVKG